MMKTFWKIVIGSFFVFFLSWLVLYRLGINSLPIQSEDTLPAAFLPLSIIKRGNLYLDEYYDQLLGKYPHPDDRSFQKGLVPFYLRYTGEHYVSAFPIITGLLAVPLYIPAVVFGLPESWGTIYFFSHLASSVIVALSGGFLFLLLRKHFDVSTKSSILLIAIYLFGTINFALVSQSLWQHGSLQLFLILFLYFMYEKKYFWSFFMFGFAILARPTVLGVAPYLGYLLLFKLKTFRNFYQTSIRAVLGLSVPAAFFFWYNSKFYLSISNQGYSNHLFTSWLGRFPEGFFGLWISPSKGLLIYSPVFIFSLVGFYLSLRNKKWKIEPDFIFFLMAVMSHTIILGSWKHWYGGYGFGYRMAADIIPFMILLLVPYIKSDLYKKTKNVFTVAVLFSVGVQVSGLALFDGIWHNAYDQGFNKTKWLWSIRDSEFVFNVRRILVKMNLLEKACPQCLPK